MNQKPDDRDKIEVVNRAEELLLRPRQVGRRIQDRISKAMAAHPLPGPHAPRPGVLVAEDEPIIRDLLELMLGGLGFEVWLAADGRQAVEVYREHRGEIGAAVLDVHMPRLDGPGALRALRELDSRVGCVFITGHPGDFHEEELLAQGAAAVLHKPFLPDELDAVLRRLLGGAPLDPVE